MAKKRQTIKDIQTALQSQTVHFSDTQNAESQQFLGGDSGIAISEESVEKLRMLASYQRCKPEELLQMALDDFFALKRRQLDAAQREQEEGRSE